MTINIGMRWDIMVPFTEVNNQIVFFDSKIPNPGAGGLPGAASKFGNCTGCAGFDRAAIKWNHYQSRASAFSYGLNNKTVIQGGFCAELSGRRGIRIRHQQGGCELRQSV